MPPRWKILILFGLFFALSHSTKAVELPTEQPYQKTLREYLGTLSEADFALQWQPLGYDEAWIDTEEKAFPVWLALEHLSTEPPLADQPGFKAPPTAFIRSSIEAEDGIRMDHGKFEVTAMSVAWWTAWNYAGNPWKGSAQLLNRAFVLAAVDLMMYDQLIQSKEGSYANRSDSIGAHLLMATYVYEQAKARLPADVRTAYEDGLLRLFSRMEELGPDVRTDNINSKSLPAAVYLASAIPTEEVQNRAKAYCERILSPNSKSRVHPAGVIRDAGGIEASYNGIALYFLTWAAAMSDWAILDEALSGMMELKSLLTLPEPDGRRYYGPSHFNTRVFHDSANDQWNKSGRDTSAAMTVPAALYLMDGGRIGRTPATTTPSLKAMQTKIQQWTDKLNTEPKNTDIYRFGIWGKTPGGFWGVTFPYAGEYCRKDFYKELQEKREKQDPQLLLPVLRETSFTKLLPETVPDLDEQDTNTFAFIRRPSYYLIVFSGRLGWHPYINWGGGGISAFWTPESGILILGRSAGYADNKWADWKKWPIHAVSGQTSAGDAFSTGRLNRSVLEVKYEKVGQEVRLIMSAPIKPQLEKGRAFELGLKGNLSGDNRYSRVIETEENLVRVTTKLISDGHDTLNELFETLPVFLKDERQQPDVTRTLIEFEINGAWQPAAQDFVPGVSRVRLTRFAGSAIITLDRPRWARVGEVWSHFQHGSEAQVQSLQFDLLDGKPSPQPFPQTEISYTIQNNIR